MNSVVRIPINNKIITEKGINDIVGIILNLKDYNNNIIKDEIVDIKIEYINGIEVNSSNKEILDDIKFKEIEINRINLKYCDFRNKNYVYINITNGNNNGGNEIRIESEDDNFIGNINLKISQWLECLPNQNKIVSFIRNHRKFTAFIVIILSLLSIVSLNDLLVNFNITISKSVFLIEAILSIIGYLSIIDYVEDWFPIVEININEKGKRYKVRKMIGWIFGFVVIPLFLNVLYDLIKFLLAK